MSSLIRQIPGFFANRQEDDVLIIENGSQGFLLSSGNEASAPTIAQSVVNLREIIGSERLARICRNPDIGIDIQKLNQNTLVLTKSVVRKIFVGLLDIQKSDIDSSPEGTIEEKYRKAIIFESLEEVEGALLGGCPKIDQFHVDKASTSGKGFEGLTERVYIAMQHHFKVLEETNAKAAELRDAEFLTSRLADREIRPGSVFHLKNGCFYADKIFNRGGAYIAVLRDLQGIEPAKIVCRGTAMRRSAAGGFTSGLNNILLEIGSLGVKKSWPHLSKYLQDEEINTVEVFGKSLGGAHAQSLAVALEGLDKVQVRKLTTYGSVGVSRRVNDLFKKEVLAKRRTPFEILVIRNGSPKKRNIDYIPAVGGAHLGHGTARNACNIEVCYIQTEDGEIGVYPARIGIKKLVRFFLDSFKTAHCRQITLNDFRWKSIHSRAEVNSHLNVGRPLERVRECFAFGVHLLTGFLLNGTSTTFLYNSQKVKRFVRAVARAL